MKRKRNEAVNFWLAIRSDDNKTHKHPFLYQL